MGGTAAIRSLGLTEERRTRSAPAPLPAPRPAALRSGAALSRDFVSFRLVIRFVKAGKATPKRNVMDRSLARDRRDFINPRVQDGSKIDSVR